MKKREIAKLIIKSIWETYTEDSGSKKEIVKDPFAKYAEKIALVGSGSEWNDEDTIRIRKDPEMPATYYAEIYYHDKYDPLDPFPNETVRLEDLKRTGFNNSAVRNIANQVPDYNPYL